ncbi:hypothetical protein INT45_009093 [Circinella minor]|uniref:Arrestin C-terminal-like domain-containing protein n=1 Tax=Circinella minor TaxID=1195481 RepID=A0A8H7RWV0_9FUNG|nr:hypothetical protein INT45_009093 [Circinella minor]
MRGRAKSGKTIDIVLNEEKFYFSGDSLQGAVIVHPKNSTKTTQIILRFTGEVVLSVKDKEIITLFQRAQNIQVSPDNDNKTTILEAKQHTFPFNFEVPKGIELPSTMEFAKKAKVRYILTAIHDRPMVPESFCPKAQYIVPILEYIDIEAPQFKFPQGKTASTPSLSSKQCQLKMTIPRTGYSRGDIVTINTIITCSESLVVTKGLRVDLIRIVDIRSGRHRFVKEDVLKTTEHDLNIIGPYNFSQAVSCQMPIPTSTPPTIGYDGMTLRMYYQIRAKVRLTDIIDKPKMVTLELPIAVGTWPLADIPIDDDDDDDSLMMSVASDIDEPISVAHHDNNNNNYVNNSNSNNSKKNSTFRMSGDITAFTLKQKKYQNSTPNIALTPQQTIDEAIIDRSDSKSSKRSESSWHSNQSWDSQPLSRNTSLTTPDKLSSSSSFARTPTLIEPSLAPSLQSTPFSNSTNRNSIHLDHYSPTYHYQQLPQPQQQQYRQSSFFPSATTSTSYPPPPRPYYPAPVPARVHDDPIMMGFSSVPAPPYSIPQNLPSNVPNHTLQPISQTATHQPQAQSMNHHITSSSPPIPQFNVKQPSDTYMIDSSDDSSDDDGDLLRIVRKNKIAEQKRKQQSMRF